MMHNNQPRRGLDAAAPDAAAGYTEGSMEDTAKLRPTKDLCKVLDFFRYKIGTSLDAALATRILRNSICWHIAFLESEGLLQVVCVKPDSTTHYPAMHYSANPALWPKAVVSSAPQYPTLFNEQDL